MERTYDSAGRVIQQVQADGGTFQISYQVVAGTFAAVTVTDPNVMGDGHENMIFFPIGLGTSPPCARNSISTLLAACPRSCAHPGLQSDT